MSEPFDFDRFVALPPVRPAPRWVLKPQNARVWYETVLAFLDRYVLDAEWKRPALL